MAGGAGSAGGGTELGRHSRSREPPRTCESGARRRRMVTELESVRLRLLVGRSPSGQELYADAFRRYGIDLPAPEPTVAAVQIRNSAIRELLLAFLYDWLLFWVWDSDKDKLRAVLDLADDDDWRRRLRETLRRDHDPHEQQSLLRAPEAVDQPPLIFGGVAYVILKRGTAVGNARALLREAQQRNPEDLWINLYQGPSSWKNARRKPSATFGRRWPAVPRSSQAHVMLGRALHDAGDTDAAIATFRKARPLTSNRVVARGPGQGPGPEGRAAGGSRPLGTPFFDVSPDYDPWDGYAQLCAFLANDEAYRWARKSLLDRSETAPTTGPWPNATAWPVCFCRFPVRNSSARVALTDVAVATGPKFFPSNLWPQFVKGLATYRQGRPQQAVPSLEESADLLPNRPGPRLALAMAQFQSGNPGGGSQDAGGRSPGLQLDGVSGGPPHRVGQPRASPRGRGPHFAGPAGVPSRSV